MRHVSAFFYLCAVLPFSDIDKIVNRVRPFTRIAVRKKQILSRDTLKP
jgi:hypothetical protein